MGIINVMTMKPTLIFIPGLLSDATTFSQQKKALSTLVDVQIVKITDYRSITHTINEIANTAPKQFILAGHSMGAWLAFEFMKRYPERVTHLIILATGATPDTPERLATRQALLRDAANQQYDKLIHFLCDAFVFQTAVYDEVYKMFYHNRGDFVDQERLMIGRDSCIPVLAKIQQPTLLMVGDQDKVFYAATLEIAQHMPHAELNVINNCGHMLTMEKPNEVSALLHAWVHTQLKGK